jgi:putative intracellular protease/amidase
MSTPAARTARRQDPVATGTEIAVVIFEGFDAYDAVTTYEVLSRLPGAAVRFVGAETGPKRTDTAMLALTADFTLADLPDPDVVVIPGGPGVEDMIGDDAVLAWLRRAHARSAWTCATAAGAEALVAAGIIGEEGASAGAAVGLGVAVAGRVIRAPGGLELAVTLARLLQDAAGSRPVVQQPGVVHLVRESVG